MSISFILMPYSTLHAHISDHEHTHMHGGHVHDLEPDHDAPSVDQVVQVNVAAATVSTPTFDWADWLPIVCIVAVLSLCRPLLTSILRPPSRDSEPIPRRSYRQPPLRGPPFFSIHAL